MTVRSNYGSNGASMLGAALEYIRMGLDIHPLHSVHDGVCSCKKGAECGKDAGKHPRLRGWLDEITSDEIKIERWWQKWPEANIGWPQGERSGTFQLDVDNDAGRFYLDVRDMPDCPTIKTGKGHRYVFKHPGRYIKTRSRIVPGRKEIGLDVIGDGKNSNSVLPPSHHYSGVRYEWMAARRLSDFPDGPPDAPQWLLDLVCEENDGQHNLPLFDRNAESGPSVATTRQEQRKEVDLFMTDGRRRGVCVECGQPTTQPYFERCPSCQATWRREQWCEAALVQSLQKLADAKPGSLNNTLNEQAYFIGMLVGVGHLTQSEAESAIERDAPHIFRKNRSKGISTMTRALSAGAANPHGLEMPNFSEHTPRNRYGPPPPDEWAAPQASRYQHAPPPPSAEWAEPPPDAYEHTPPQAAYEPPPSDEWAGPQGDGHQSNPPYTPPKPEFTFDQLKVRIEQAVSDESVTKDDLTDMIDEWTDSAVHLKGREINKLCKLLRKGKVTARTLQEWRADIKEIQAEIKAAKADHAPLRPSGQRHVPVQSHRKNVNLLDFEINDAGNADAFIALHGDKFRHVEEWGWLYYTGTHWEKTGAGKRVFETVKAVLRVRIKAALNGIKDEDKLKKYLTRCAPTTKNINACLTQLCNAVALEGLPKQFDKHKFLLNVANGVLDLTTGQLLSHDPNLLMTFCLDTAYNPYADQRLITGFLQGLGLSEAVIDYLQEAVGYTLTGTTREECLFYIHGPTRSGKGTFMAALRALMGSPLSAEIKFDILTGSKRNDPDAQNFALAPLKACRFVVASESGKYSTLNEAKVKQLTGGDSVYCAFKGKTHFNYTPQFKIWLTSNHAPKADVDDDAIWKSRLKLIEFPNSFLGQENKGLKDTLVNEPAYQEALLAWAVNGAFRWYNSPRGLVAPREVRAATERARAELDHIQQWLDECTEDDEHARTPNSELYQSYQTWSNDNGVSPKKKRAFGRAMKAKGYQPHKWRVGLKTVRGFVGVFISET